MPIRIPKGSRIQGGQRAVDMAGSKEGKISGPTDKKLTTTGPSDKKLTTTGPTDKNPMKTGGERQVRQGRTITRQGPQKISKRRSQHPTTMKW